METSDDDSNSSSEEVNEDIPTVKEVELDHVIRLSAWSPSMDIFAVAYEENNEVVRLKVQRSRAIPLLLYYSLNTFWFSFMD